MDYDYMDAEAGRPEITGPRPEREGEERRGEEEGDKEERRAEEDYALTYEEGDYIEQ